MYDAVIVGARCAGSPLAMLLARAGHRVLAVDRSTFPSDIMSTHYIQPDGVKRLQDWGLYERVMASNCPEIPQIKFHLGGVLMPTPQDPALPNAICPRRTVLDSILVDGAREAGADVREGFSVQEILVEGGAVVGLRGRNADGATVEERARVTIGADGHHSLVARAVAAREYDVRPAYTCGYYSYFSGVPLPEGAEAYVGDKVGVLAFPTNDSLTCIGVGSPHERFHDYRDDIEGTFYRLLEMASPPFAERVRAGKRQERWIGTADTENFFRQPYGPGWALCGDAGYHKDFVTGLGISDAFRDAAFLAEALHDGFANGERFDEALAAYQRRRDEAAKPMYEMTTQIAQFPTLEEMAAGMAQAAAGAGASPQAGPGAPTRRAGRYTSRSTRSRAGSTSSESCSGVAGHVEDALHSTRSPKRSKYVPFLRKREQRQAVAAEEDVLDLVLVRLQLLARLGTRLAEQLVHLLLADAVEAPLRLPALAMPVLDEAAVRLGVGDGIAAEEPDAEAAQPQQHGRHDARALQQLNEVAGVDLGVVVVHLDGERRHDEHRLGGAGEHDDAGGGRGGDLGDAVDVIGRERGFVERGHAAGATVAGPAARSRFGQAREQAAARQVLAFHGAPGYGGVAVKRRVACVASIAQTGEAGS